MLKIRMYVEHEECGEKERRRRVRPYDVNKKSVGGLPNALRTT